MKHHRISAFLAMFLSFLASLDDSPAVITVNGIADEDIENDEATFTVPGETGFTIEALLNSSPVAIDSSIVVTTPGYYELAITKTNDSDATEESVVLQFIVLDSNRGTSERGLINWIPRPTIDSAPLAFAGGDLEIITPPALPLGFAIPVIARVRDSATGVGMRLNGTIKIPESPGTSIRILRGFGSGFLPAPASGGPLALTPTLHSLDDSKTVQIEASTAWTTVNTDITSNTDWGDNARVQITGNITIADGVTLTIGAGSVIQLSSGVDVELDGTLLINGTPSSPVFLTPEPGGNPWGGFFLRGANSAVTATGAIFTGSGADSDWFSGSGFSAHRKEQATFLFDDNTTGSFTDCFFIDLPGQALHGDNAVITLTDCIVQRVPTVGQFNNGGGVTVTRSALIEFPKNDNIFNDDDNDGIYFTEGTYQLVDSVIGWAKDDGVDAGSGDTGTVTVTGCWFEACYHEGMAWSGEGRTANVSNSVAYNCGQGIEAGWSGNPTANSPIVTVTNSLCIGNHVGLRFGDNYDWDYDGQLNVSGSLSLYNDRNVWGYEWDSWNYRSEKMTIENNHLSSTDSRHPTNSVWDGASNGALLVPFSSAPGAPVGCGFGEWSTQKSLSAYGEDVLLSLSEFSTQAVTIDYEIAGDSTILASGSALFQPGEIRKWITPPALDGESYDLVRVTLLGSTGSEITTTRNLFYVAPPGGETGGPQPLIPAGSDWRYLDDGSDQGIAWRDPGFSDASWASAPAQLGYGDDDEDTVINDQLAGGGLIATTYFRHSFNVEDPAQFGSLDIRLLRDDGGIVYLNGVEIFRSRIDPGLIAFDDFTGNITSGGDEDIFFETSIPASQLLTGVNVIAVEVHQANDTSSDVSFDFELLAHPPQALTFLLLEAGNEINLLWQGEEDLMLQSSEFLDTGWTDMPNATSPHLIRPSELDPRKFFRLVR